MQVIGGGEAKWGLGQKRSPPTQHGGKGRADLIGIYQVCCVLGGCLRKRRGRWMRCAVAHCVTKVEGLSRERDEEDGCNGNSP
jgi:hypothetical protein